MARPLFNQIVTNVSNHDPFFRTNMDCARRQAISRLLKCASTIRQLAYAVMEIYGPEYLRKPTVTDIENFNRNTRRKARVSKDVRKP
ncbi:hypothetical protein Tco_0201516 [Tanacetum coccineum]